jgi:hypothetical protein
MKAIKLIGTMALGCLGGFGGFFISNKYFSETPKAYIVEKGAGSNSNARTVNFEGVASTPVDFTVAAESSINSVVHIGSTYKTASSG